MKKSIPLKKRAVKTRIPIRKQHIVRASLHIKAGVKTLSDADTASTSQTVLGIEAGLRRTTKLYIRLRYTEAKAGVNGVILLGRGYTKLRHILKEKKKLDLLQAATSAKTSYTDVVTPALRNVADYDYSSLEQKNGIQTPSKQLESTKEATERKENRLKVKERKTDTKSTGVKETKSLSNEEKVERGAEKNKLKSKKNKENLHKKKRISHNGIASAVAKREMKLIVVKQLLDEGKSMSITDSFVHIGEAVAIDFLQLSSKKLFRTAQKSFLKVTFLLGSLLLQLFMGFVSVCLLFLSPVIVVITGVVLVIAGIALFAGFFLNPGDITKENFAVSVIETYTNQLVQEIDTYESNFYEGYPVETVYVTYSGIDTLDANRDDLLLAYMTLAAENQTFESEESYAPILNVDKREEQQVMRTVLNEMLYIEDVTYEVKEREVLVKVESSEETTQEEMWVTQTEQYAVAEVIVVGKTADTWAIKQGIVPEDGAFYWLLLDIFESFGYTAGGGDVVCRKYQEASLQ